MWPVGLFWFLRGCLLPTQLLTALVPPGWRAILQYVDQESPVELAKKQFRWWLWRMYHRDTRKTIQQTVWDAPGVHWLGPDSALTVIERADESEAALLFLEYLERTDVGIWSTRLYAAADSGGSDATRVICIEGGGQSPAGSPLYAATAAILPRTVHRVDAYDGSVPILSDVRIIEVQELDALAGYIADPQRSISIVIAVSVPGLPASTWARSIASLMKDAIGCASFFVIEPETAHYLLYYFGDSHEVRPGSLRIFVPGVRANSSDDATRHPVFTSRVLSAGLNADGRFSPELVRAVAEVARAHVLRAALPSVLHHAVTALRQEYSSVAGEALAMITRPATAGAPRAIVREGDTESARREIRPS